MRTVKTFFLLFVFLSALTLLVDRAAAQINITDADATFERVLQRVDIPTQAVPLAKLFILNEDAASTKALSTASIPTQAARLAKLFVVNEEAILEKDLLNITIPMQPRPVTKLFIINADAILTKDLAPLDGTMLPVQLPISSFALSLDEGLNMVSLPLKPQVSLTARSFAQQLGSTMVIRYDTKRDEFLAFVPEVFEGDGFPIEGGRGYIVNLLDSREVIFTGTAWSNAPSKTVVERAAGSFSIAPSKQKSHWAFVVCGTVYDGNRMAQNPPYPPFTKGGNLAASVAKGGNLAISVAEGGNLGVSVENLRTGDVAEATVGQLESGRYTTAFVDRGRKDVVSLGHSLGVRLRDIETGAISRPIIHTVTSFDIQRSYIEVTLRMEYFVPEKSALLQNYPNPFNPDTWIPYQLEKDADVVIRIHTATGQLVRVLNLGHKRAGFYTDKEAAAYWDGKDEAGEHVASGVFFYTIRAGDFTAVRKLAVLK